MVIAILSTLKTMQVSIFQLPTLNVALPISGVLALERETRQTSPGHLERMPVTLSPCAALRGTSAKGVARRTQRSFAALRMTGWRSAGQAGAQVDSLARRTQRSFAALRMTARRSAGQAGAQVDSLARRTQRSFATLRMTTGRPG